MPANQYTIDYTLSKNIPLPSKSYRNLSNSNNFIVKNNFEYNENENKLFLLTKTEENSDYFEIKTEVCKDEFFQSLKDIVDYESELRIHETVFYQENYKKNEKKLKENFKKNNSFIFPSDVSKIFFDNGIGFIKNNKTNEFLCFFHFFNFVNPPNFSAQIKDFYPVQIQSDIMNEISERRYSNTKYDYYFYNIEEDCFYQMFIHSTPNVRSDIYSTLIEYNFFQLKYLENTFEENDKKILKQIFELNKNQDDKELLNEMRATFIHNKNKNFKDMEKIKKYSDIEF